MKKIIISLLFISSVIFVIAQVEKQKSTEHKIVFQLSNNDTMAHKALMKQLGNITSVAPNTKIEVVCHGPGLDMLVVDKSTVNQKVSYFAERGIAFLACEFSMSERKVEKEKITKDASFVKAGIIEIVSKQEQGWSYIKSGF
ncbi:MAG: DsrE family protein [Bacteroidota bacterium]|nr:DsrE family protein [Bacteroidota bacterium]